MMNRLMVLFLLSAVLTFVQPASADDYSGYEDIIRDLRGSSSAPLTNAADGDSFDAIKIHAGVGLVTTRTNLKLPQGTPRSAGLRGVEAALGIDLFSPKWIAEGSVRSFNREKYADTNINLKEFDLRLVHKHALSESLFARFGGGMAARYLDFDQVPVAGASRSYTTPATVILIGIGSQITSGIALSAEANYRSALIADTADSNSLDGAVKITGSF
jgi:hypothetical protein